MSFDILSSPEWFIVGGLFFVGATLVRVSRRLDKLASQLTGAGIILNPTVSVEPCVVVAPVTVRIPDPPQDERAATLTWLREQIDQARADEHDYSEFTTLLNKLLFDPAYHAGMISTASPSKDST